MTPTDLARHRLALSFRGAFHRKDPALLACARQLLAEVEDLRAAVQSLTHQRDAARDSCTCFAPSTSVTTAGGPPVAGPAELPVRDRVTVVDPRCPECGYPSMYAHTCRGTGIPITTRPHGAMTEEVDDGYDDVRRSVGPVGPAREPSQRGAGDGVPVRVRDVRGDQHLDALGRTVPVVALVGPDVGGDRPGTVAVPVAELDSLGGDAAPRGPVDAGGAADGRVAPGGMGPRVRRGDAQPAGPVVPSAAPSHPDVAHRPTAERDPTPGVASAVQRWLDPQPDPVGDGPSVTDWLVEQLGEGPPFEARHELLVEVLLERRRQGVERYGVELRAANGRCALRDALQEAADLVLYLAQHDLERGMRYMSGRTSQGISVLRQLVEEVERDDEMVGRWCPHTCIPAPSLADEGWVECARCGGWRKPVPL